MFELGCFLMFFPKTNGNDLQNLVAQGCDCFQYSDRCMWKRPTVARCLGANEAAGGSWLAANGGDLQFSHDPEWEEVRRLIQGELRWDQVVNGE